MCLSIKVDFPDLVLSEGSHLGFEWITVHNNMGFRCGYVRVPKEHPWYGKDYNDLDVSVHGGLTFGEKDKPCAKGGADDGFWFGFDCAHGGDAQDPGLPTKHLGPYRFSGVVRTQGYVEAQCKRLCEQAKEAEKG